MALGQFGSSSYGGGLSGQSIDQWRRQQADQYNRAGAFAGSQPPAAAAATVSPEDAKRAADLAEQEGLSTAGINRLKNDSTDTMLRDYMRQQMSAQTLDPTGKPFANGAPQYTAQGYTPATAQAQTWKAAQMGAAPQIGGGGPWDATSKAAYMTDATDRAASGESARNQMIRDALLQSGGNASDPALAGAYAESMSQRNSATAQAGNQLNMRATSDNFGAQRQADLANQGANMSQMQFNAGNQQQANSNNAALAQQTQYANQGARNQASQFGASAQNQAGMFNTGNNMQASLANFNAGTQAQMYNQGQQTQAAGQLAGYNNQRENMLQNAEGNRIGLIGQNRYQTQAPQQGGGGGFMPSFQQFNQQAPRPQQQNAGMQNPSTAGGLTGSVWAGSGRPSVGSGMTTNQFGPTQVGNPFGPGYSASGTSSINRAPVQGVPNLLARPPAAPDRTGFQVAPQIKKPLPNNYNSPW